MPERVATKTSEIAAPIAMTIDTGFKESGWTMEVPIVVATAVVKINGPAMLQIEVRSTACHGDRDFVATTVAIECAASLSPFTKFRASARITPNTMRGSMDISCGSG
jgi:hypothetical protein